MVGLLHLVLLLLSWGTLSKPQMVYISPDEVENRVYGQENVAAIEYDWKA